MDISEFASRVPPAGARSRMAPFLGQLVQLRERAYTLAQLQDFLRRNGVEVSVAAVSAYLIRHAPGASSASAGTHGAQVKDSPSRPREDLAATPAPVRRSPDAAGLQALLRAAPADLDSLIRQGRRMKPR
jgi:hypothetical protein